MSELIKIYQRRNLSLEQQMLGESNWDTMIETPSTTGLLYINLIPSDDDIVGSVALQISQPPTIRMATNQMNALMMQFNKRNRADSFLFTFLRSPTERVIRDFFFHMITLRKYEPSDTAFMNYLEERDYYTNRNLKELELHTYDFRKYNITNEDSMATVKSIIQGYDFLGISERRDESLLVLKIILGLRMNQILYVESPIPFAYDEKDCYLLAQPFVSPNMKKYFASKAWQDHIRGDALLYTLANQSLDATIDSIGRRKFDHELRRFRKYLNSAREICEAKVAFQCNYNGIWQRSTNKCTYDRYGCASQCLNSKDLLDTLDQIDKVFIT